MGFTNPAPTPDTIKVRERGIDYFAWPCVAGEPDPPTLGAGAQYARNAGENVVSLSSQAIGCYVSWGAYNAHGPDLSARVMVMKAALRRPDAIADSLEMLFGYMTPAAGGGNEGCSINLRRTASGAWVDRIMCNFAGSTVATVPYPTSVTVPGNGQMVGVEVRFDPYAGAVYKVEGVEVYRHTITAPLALGSWALTARTDQNSPGAVSRVWAGWDDAL